MIDRDEESLAEWLFYTRKQQRRRRTTHTTHSTSTNTKENSTNDR